MRLKPEVRMHPLAVRLAALFLIGVLAGALAFTPESKARADSWWTWPTYPYLRDPDGNYAYRDMEFAWTTWTFDQTYVSGVYIYVQIASPLSGYHYDSWNTDLSDDQPPDDYTPGSHYVDYSSGLDYWAALSGSHYSYAPSSGVDVITSVCESTLCQFLVYISEGNYMAARVYSGQTTASCVWRRIPDATYC